MKKIGMLILGMFLTIVIAISVNIFLKSINQQKNIPERVTLEQINDKYISSVKYIETEPNNDNEYQVFVQEKFHTGFDSYDKALAFAKDHKKSLIKQKGNTDYIWDNYMPYIIYIDSENFYEFETFAEAVKFGKNHKTAYLYYRKDNSYIWTNTEEIKTENFIENINLLNQFPELPRGCEITSLCMLLNYKNIEVDKLTLASEIKKNPQPYAIINGQVNYGNPHNGFVGDMFNIKNPGLGVYHEPIYELLQKYIKNSSVDLTGAEFNDILFFISNDIPVWVITNLTYNTLPEKSFEQWQTEDGIINITYKEHSVLITGYDENYIYFNDPYGVTKQIPINNFKNAWEQMGRQAVSTTY